MKKTADSRKKPFYIHQNVAQDGKISFLLSLSNQSNLHYTKVKTYKYDRGKPDSRIEARNAPNNKQQWV